MRRFALLVCLCLAACGDAGADPGLPAYQAGSTADEGPTVTAAPQELARLLRSMSLITADVKHLGLVVSPDEDATSLEWPSVELCDDREYPSESHRVARYQVLADVPGGSKVPDGDEPWFGYVDLMSSVTAYDSPESARQALQEWRASHDGSDTQCGASDGVLVAGVGLGDVSERADPSLPIPDNSVTTAVLTLQGKGEVARSITVFQRHGNLLAEVTYDAGDVHDLADLKRLATVLGRRIVETAGSGRT